MSLLTLLRIVALVVWLPVLLWALPAVWRAYRGTARRYDPFLAVLSFFGLLMVTGTARWWIMPSDDSYAAVYALAILLGLQCLRLCYTYARGDRG